MDQVAEEASSFEELDGVVIRFAGDSGDGMQLTGSQFTGTSALFGNDIATLPDFPAEIRAPAGTIFGVSGFQIKFGKTKVNTPGDHPDVLVAMNPAALRANLKDIKSDGMVLINQDAFSESAYKKAGYAEGDDPLSSEHIGGRQLHKLPITTQTLNALEGVDITHKSKEKCKNLFTLGFIFWLYDRSPDYTIQWLEGKFSKKPEVAQANIKALKEGMIYAQNCGFFQSQYRVPAAELPPGTYKSITGNQALSLGCLAASEKADRSLYLAGYPITPASDILHELSKWKDFGVKTLQAEDEIASVCAALGASYAGALAITCSSGPGIALKGEALGLGVMVELPLIVINVQRGGPSTGLPTKTEQADLFQAAMGRNGECPLVVLAPKTPGDCFYMAIEAARLAMKYMTPVMLLSDGYLANGSEPFRIPQVEDLPDLRVNTEIDPENFSPYGRDPETLARAWATPGMPGLEHRITGIESEDVTGNISYNPENHHKMVGLRQQKIDGIANDIPDLEIFGDQDGGEVLVVGWGSTYGSIRANVEARREKGESVSHAHLNHIVPFPKNTGEVLKKFKKVLVPEMNMGQLNLLLRAKFLVDTVALNKVHGKPFRVDELSDAIDKLLKEGK